MKNVGPDESAKVSDAETILWLDLRDKILARADTVEQVTHPGSHFLEFSVVHEYLSGLGVTDSPRPAVERVGFAF